MNSWYTLFTKPNAELRVSSTLKGRGIEIFLPQIRVSKNGLKKPVLEPLFPRYLFMWADLKEISPADWRWTPGLLYMVNIAGEPAVISEATITRLRQEMMRWDKAELQPPVPYNYGEVVRIKRGPFTDLLAVFDGMLDGNGRSRVLVNFLGHVSRAKVDLDDLEKAPPRAVDWSPHLPRRTRGRGRWIRT